MDNNHILSDEEHMEPSLIHKNGHWTQPPPPLLQTVKLVHRSSVLGGCICINYIIFSLIISFPHIYLLNIPSSFCPHPSEHNKKNQIIPLNHFVTFSSYRGNARHKYFYFEVFLITKLIL